MNHYLKLFQLWWHYVRGHHTVKFHVLVNDQPQAVGCGCRTCKKLFWANYPYYQDCFQEVQR